MRNKKRFLTVGITGGVGAGKSSVLKFIEDNFNCSIIMADDLAKELCLKDGPCFLPLVKLLGEDIVGSDGQIDRNLMASRIFSDEELRLKVNAIIHPAVKKSIKKSISDERKAGKLDFLFVEAALLIEDGYNAILDEMWYIYTDAEIRRERLKASRGYSDAKIDSIFEGQLSDEEFRKACDFVIDNSFDQENTFSQIRERMKLYEQG